MIKKNKIYIIDNNCLLKNLPYKRQIFPLTQVHVFMHQQMKKNINGEFRKKYLINDCVFVGKKQGNSRL